VEILDIVGFFNIHLMIHDPSKHIIGCLVLVSGVMADQSNHIIVHRSIGHHQSLHQHMISPILGP
jgi:hypothetical protein